MATLFQILANIFFPLIEKATLWGEAFVVLIALSFLITPISANRHQKPILFAVFIWTFLLPIYGTVISQIYWPPYFEPYYLIRHAVFFYASIFFFFAFHYAPAIVAALQRWSKFLVFYTPFAIFFFGDFHAGAVPILGLMLVGLSKFKSDRRPFLAGYVAAAIILLVSRGSGTNKYIFAFYLAIPFLMPLARFWTTWFPPLFRKICVWLFAAIFVTVALQLIHAFYEMTSQMALLGETIANLAPLTEEYHTDLGGFWRLVLWSHLYGRFLDFPWGVGLGTPLFEHWLDGFVMLHLQKPGENYVQGAHNSFVTLITRLGVPGLILLSAMFYQFLKLARKAFAKLDFRPFHSREGRLLVAVLLAFGSIIISASFNIVLESPLSAGNFWFCFGLFTRLFGDCIEKSDLPVGTQAPVKKAVKDVDGG